MSRITAICFSLQRVLIPAVLVIAALIRPVGISYIYMLMFFIAPFVPIATNKKRRRPINANLFILLTISIIILLTHLILQLLIIFNDLKNDFGACSLTEQIFRHIGFIDFRNVGVLAIIEWLSPEVLVFITSTVVFIIIKKLTAKTDHSLVENGDVIATENNPDVSSTTQQGIGRITQISPLFCMTTLFFSAILRPSVPGGFYFLIFLICGTYWATYRTLLSRGFAILMRLMLVVLALHILLFVGYQTPWLQQTLPHDSLIARLLGLEPLIISSCEKDIRFIIYNLDLNIVSFINPIVMFFSYYAIALTSRNILKKNMLMRTNLKKQGPRIVIENSRASGDADIPLDTIQSDDTMERSHGTHEDNSSIFEHFWYGIVSVGGFIYQNSYIFTNILMMTWAIVYHSWLTFVLLLWANLLWMIPNQRTSMMRSSPLVTLYAELLVVAQYIYGMNLNNNELPTKVDVTGINLAQIGFERPQEHDTQPCVPLIVKTLFLLMFWVTLRQFSKEKKYRKLGQKLSHISFSSSKYESKKTSKFLKHAGTVIKNLLVRLWMWLLVLVIFLCAISGKQMTGFRICYMGLFLFFLLVFQSSSQAWIKIMYGFWLFLIFYSMSILILIYTYQFDKFDQYWNDYLNISKTLQTDIGLVRYKTKDLFLHLVSPTVIVILTVIQVHYFHKRFITALEHRTLHDRPSSFQRSRSRSSIRASKKSYRLSETDFEQSFKDLVRQGLKKIKHNSKYLFINTKKLFWRLMELHAIKLVYLFAFLCCVSEVCLLHIVLVVLCLIGVMARSFLHIFISRVISLVVTVIVIIRMIYQIAYLDHNRYNVTCDSNNQTVYNNAFWFGVAKASKETGNLIGLLKMHIIYMMMVTLHAVVTLRHQKKRDDRPSEIYFQKVLFPGVSRADAEKDFRGMLKYLSNYGFYKFGLEITLIMLASNIAFRRDIVALLYVCWLIILALICNRTKNARIWIVFQWFMVVSIIIQYIILVGLPPSLCITYPWTSSPYAEKIERWAMLPGDYSTNHLPKLVFDFIVLYVARRQQRVFVIEKHYEHHNIPFPGGSNSNVVSDIAKLGVEPFVNPTRDFLTNIHNYLDIFKNIVLCSFYWITLAIVFYAGTCITDFLALGYLIGSFIFLWQGSDFFLLPIHTIIKRWEYLLAFNVASIAVKTALQMAGCLFFKELQENCCWLIHIFGITCSISRTSAYIDDFETFTSEECPAPTKQVVLLWDAICFGFILLQLRIFKSYYFCHIIADAKANNLLASRGAEIIEDLRQKQIEHRHEHEILVLHKIKRKMEKIRATQRKIKPIDKPAHYDEYGNVISGPRSHKRQTHPEAVRAGDYYMFDDMDKKFELDLIEDEVDFLDDQDNMTPSEKRINRRKALYDIRVTKDAKLTHENESDKFKDLEEQQSSTIIRPGTSKEGASESSITDETKKTREPGAVEVPGKELDDDLNANPIVRLLEGFLVSLSIRLNRFSRNYRYVNKILTEEKKAVKESPSLYQPKGSAVIQLIKKLDRDDKDEPPSSSTARSAQNNQDITPQDQTNTTTPPNTSPITNTKSTNQTLDSDSQKQSQSDQQDQYSQDSQSSDENRASQKSNTSKSSQPQNPDAIIEIPVDTVDTGRYRTEQQSNVVSARSHADFNFEDDDFVTREHHVVIEVLISAWYALLANTDLICYIVIFINQVVNASIIALPIPLMVFLWGTLSLPRPTKTFWVTLIGYTELVVLIKCVFQYKLIWANYTSIGQPLAPAKIIGVQWNPDYATYDLMVLLALFFHRFILKSQGLWKSNYELALRPVKSSEVSIRDDDAASTPGGSKSLPARVLSVTKKIHILPKRHDEAVALQEVDSTEQNEKESTDSSQISEEEDKRSKYLSSSHTFFHSLLHKSRLPTDVYALMFLCDFVNFFVLLFGFTAFGAQQPEGGGGVQKYLSEDKVPIPFLIMLLIQFILIVIDRALYLRKALFYKIIFHFLSVIGIHVWMFFVVPAVTERSFYASAPPVIFYIIKCFYMLLSSYQIKCGYPKRIWGNFLTKNFSLVNMITFKVYMFIPFLYELRTILDWVSTDTTMTIFDWLKMEDIFSNIFFIKCSRQMESDFPAMRAEKKPLFTKLLTGGSVILLIVISIWGPLCLFALGNAVGQPNVPSEVSISIRIGSYDPIYSANSRESIYTFDQAMFSDMESTYIRQKGALTFLNTYDAEDIAVVKLAANSPSMWNISPPDKERLLQELETDSPLKVRLTYSFTRIPEPKGASGVSTAEVSFDIGPEFKKKEPLIKMLKGTADPNDVFVLPEMVPKFIKILNNGGPSVVHVLMPPGQVYRPLILKMHAPLPGSVWWEILDFTDDDFYTTTLSKLPLSKNNTGVIMYTFNDKKFPSTFSFLTASGIIGLYTTFVLLASRLIKSFMSGLNRHIMFEDLPYVDRVLQLCMDIYLVREAHEFTLEEDLFAKLIFLYRSPETIIKWTRPKEEIAEDETDTESVRSRSSTRRHENLH